MVIKVISGADEVQARCFAAAIALEIGCWGILRVVVSAGISHLTVDKVINELKYSKGREV